MSARTVSMQRVPRAGRWSIYVALALLFAIACAYLAHWQFSRNDERATQLALVAQNYDAAPVPLEELLDTDDDLDAALRWRPVEVTGHYLADEQVLARNRVHGGTAAYEVLTPLQLDDGRVLIVDRGWVPPGSDGENPATVPAPPTGQVNVVGRLQPSESLPPSGRGAPAGQVPTIHLPSVAEQTGTDTITGAYVLMSTEDPAPAERPAAVEAPSEDPGPHLSYAIQWILFAVMGFVFIGYVIRTERRHRSEDDESEGAGPRSRRRRDRDADDEDALLDAVR